MKYYIKSGDEWVQVLPSEITHLQRYRCVSPSGAVLESYWYNQED